MSRYPLLDTGLTQALGQGFGLGLQRRRLDEDARQQAIENERRAILDAFLMELQRERLSLDQRELGERERNNAAILDLRQRESARQDEELRIRLADEARRAADAVRLQREREATSDLMGWIAQRLGVTGAPLPADVQGPPTPAQASALTFRNASPDAQMLMIEQQLAEAEAQRAEDTLRILIERQRTPGVVPIPTGYLRQQIDKLLPKIRDARTRAEAIAMQIGPAVGLDALARGDARGYATARLAAGEEVPARVLELAFTPQQQRATTLANDRTYQRLIRKVRQKQSAYERAERAYWQVFEEHGGDAFAENEPAVQAARRRLEQAERELDAAEEAEAMYEPGGEQQRPGPALAAPSAAAASAPPQAGPVAAVEPDDADLDAAFDQLGPDATDEEVWNLAVQIRSRR